MEPPFSSCWHSPAVAVALELLAASPDAIMNGWTADWPCLRSRSQASAWEGGHLILSTRLQ
jgi:hypothetical protein